jgi:GntR family transcriptional regulator
MSTDLGPGSGSDLPRWAQVLEDLRGRLARGEFATGFPADSALVATYGVSRHTVRHAVRVLQDEGLLTRQRGRGSFVRPAGLEQSIGPLYSVFRTIEDQGFEQRSIVLALDERRDAEAADHLGLAPDAALVFLHRIRFADATPFAIDRIWMPAATTSALLDVDFGHTALYAELETRCGLRPRSGTEHIHPALPTFDEAQHLDIDPFTAVFSVWRRTDHDHGPLEWRHTVLRGDRFRFTTTWAPGTSGAQYDLHSGS